ncbi:jouberin-like [Schistocerca americana]|uniref:jouberin-like n=1 Tax=Schistocerca americana TaxID=7009 RepID=UPI001F4FDDC5|nr:jouberin-like [Schistocerca americana]
MVFVKVDMEEDEVPLACANRNLRDKTRKQFESLLRSAVKRSQRSKETSHRHGTDDTGQSADYKHTNAVPQRKKVKNFRRKYDSFTMDSQHEEPRDTAICNSTQSLLVGPQDKGEQKERNVTEQMLHKFGKDTKGKRNNIKYSERKSGQSNSRITPSEESSSLSIHCSQTQEYSASKSGNIDKGSAIHDSLSNSSDQLPAAEYGRDGAINVTVPTNNQEEECQSTTKSLIEAKEYQKFDSCDHNLRHNYFSDSEAFKREKRTSRRISYRDQRKKKFNASDSSEKIYEDIVLHHNVSEMKKSRSVCETTPECESTTSVYHSSEEISGTNLVDSEYSAAELDQRSNHSDYEELACKKVVTGLPDAQNSSTKQYTYEKVIGLFVHKTDHLKTNNFIRHPTVKVHILNSETGEKLEKSDKKRCVSFFHENDVEHILPLMTKPYNFREKRSSVPCWEELLVFNEDINYILTRNPPVIIIFEILDMIKLHHALTRYESQGSKCGWHKIAWAFLKPLGANGHLNIDKKIRLQLYKPNSSKETDYHGCEAYRWWKNGSWKLYPSSLYVMVKGITEPRNLPPSLRSHVALQPEISSSVQLNQESEPKKQQSHQESATVEKIQWSRLPFQSCKVPNHCVSMFGPTTQSGCLSLSFSHSGSLLACGMDHEICIYEIASGNKIFNLTGHQGLVYNISWSHNDNLLLSASSDSTACLWNIESGSYRPLQILPHPSFVYVAQFHVSKSTIVVTGCFDHMVRVWSKLLKDEMYELLQELDIHKGFITSLSLNKDGILISADSIGVIVLWKSTKVSKHQYKWEFKKKIELHETRGITINYLVLHPGGRRLLVHARDSLLRMVDLATGSSIQWFRGAVNYRFQSAACITPCGSLVFCGSEDGTVHVWNADTGDEAAIYTKLKFGGSGSCAVSSVTYHPHDHIVAFASHSSFSHILLCSFSKQEHSNTLGIHFFRDCSANHITRGADDEDNSYNDDDPIQRSLTSLSASKGMRKLSDSLLNMRFLKRNQQVENLKYLQSPPSEEIGDSSDVVDNTDTRLLGIIQEMDRILSNTSSKASSQCISFSQLHNEENEVPSKVCSQHSNKTRYTS